MAGTMPHAVFVETDLPSGGCAAYAAELPGCAAFAQTDDEAVADIPRRVEHFTSWLRGVGERVPSFAGGNWYEVERVSAAVRDGPVRRAIFSLDDLPPSDDEFERYLRWLELARERLAEALDRADLERAAEEVAAIERQDAASAAELGDPAPKLGAHPLDRLFLARDAFAAALEAAGPSAPGARRMLRIAIADDLRAADRLAVGAVR
jgi:hypothetical protein